MKKLILASCGFAACIGWILGNLIVLGGVYGYVLYEYNIHGKKFEFDLLKSRMTIDEFMDTTSPEDMVRIMKAKGFHAKMNDDKKSCILVASN